MTVTALFVCPAAVTAPPEAHFPTAKIRGGRSDLPLGQGGGGGYYLISGARGIHTADRAVFQGMQGIVPQFTPLITGHPGDEGILVKGRSGVKSVHLAVFGIHGHDGSHLFTQGPGQSPLKIQVDCEDQIVARNRGRFIEHRQFSPPWRQPPPGGPPAYHGVHAHG